MIASLAKIENPQLSNSIRNLSGVEFMNRFLPNMITIFFIVAAVASLVIMIIGGIKWITAGGDKEATMKAQKTITSAVVGLVFVFFIYAILKFLEYFFGINLIVIDLEPLILK